MIRDLRRDTEDSGRVSPEAMKQREMVVGWREQLPGTELTNSLDVF